MYKRKDIVVLELLMEEQCINSITFNCLIQLMVNFIDEVLLIDETIAIPIDRQYVVTECLAPAKLFLLRDIKEPELEQYRIRAWECYDSKDDKARYLIRTSICCMYDEQTADFESYGAEAVLETFLSCLRDINEKYCMIFYDYSINNLKKNS